MDTRAKRARVAYNNLVSDEAGVQHSGVDVSTVIDVAEPHEQDLHAVVAELVDDLIASVAERAAPELLLEDALADGDGLVAIGAALVVVHSSLQPLRGASLREPPSDQDFRGATVTATIAAHIPPRLEVLRSGLASSEGEPRPEEEETGRGTPPCHCPIGGYRGTPRRHPMGPVSPLARPLAGSPA